MASQETVDDPSPTYHGLPIRFRVTFIVSAKAHMPKAD
jgi:hypothetical protein